MTIKIEKISAAMYKVVDDITGAAMVHYYDTANRLISDSQCFSDHRTIPMCNNDMEILKIWCKEQDLPFPHSASEGTDTLSTYEPCWIWVEATETVPAVKRRLHADSVNVTLAKAETGQYRIEWRNSESGKTRFIVNCYGCANSLQVARGIAFAQCAKVTHPMSKPSNDLSDHP
jgi:hypothetical protein